MPGPVPKPAALRQRRNRVSTASTLSDQTSTRRAPSLPKPREWLKQTRGWWRDVWRSPMAAEYLESDVHGLYLLAELVDRFWVSPTAAMAKEIRQQRMCFGLTPIDRRRLQWEVEKVEAVQRRQQPPAPKPNEDPRRLLELVQ